MNSYEFLDDLESRVDGVWTEDDTFRLWQMSSYRMSRADIRAVYSKTRNRREALIKSARDRLVEHVVKRLDE